MAPLGNAYSLIRPNSRNNLRSTLCLNHCRFEDSHIQSHVIIVMLGFYQGSCSVTSGLKASQGKAAHTILGCPLLFNRSCSPGEFQLFLWPQCKRVGGWGSIREDQRQKTATNASSSDPSWWSQPCSLSAAVKTLAAKLIRSGIIQGLFNLSFFSVH